MRIVLVQMRIDPGSRAGNLARALRWIDRACAGDPSPDLVVLPAGCDAAGFGPADPPVSLSMAQAFSQSVALKAREWGTYVAVGFHQPVDHQRGSSGAVYDPDGDAIARLSATRPGQAGPAASISFTLARTPLGCWSLLLTDKPWEADLPQKLRDARVRLAVVLDGATAEVEECLRARCEQLARQAGLYVCAAVGLAGQAKERVCQAWDSAGQAISRGTLGVEELVPVTVALRPGSGRPAADRGGAADTPAAKEH